MASLHVEVRFAMSVRSPSVCLVRPHPLALSGFKKNLCRNCRVIVVSDCSLPTQNVLTDREGEVLQLLKHHLSNKEIGLKLVVSESTVKFHVANIFSKLGIHDRQSVLDFDKSTALPQLGDPAPANAATPRVP